MGFIALIIFIGFIAFETSFPVGIKSFGIIIGIVVYVIIKSMKKSDNDISMKKNNYEEVMAQEKSQKKSDAKIMSWQNEELEKRGKIESKDSKCKSAIKKLWNNILIYNDNLPIQLRLKEDEYHRDIMPTVHAPKAYVSMYDKYIWIGFHHGSRNINSSFDNDAWIRISFHPERNTYYCEYSNPGPYGINQKCPLLEFSERDFELLFKNVCTGKFTLKDELRNIIG